MRDFTAWPKADSKKMLKKWLKDKSFTMEKQLKFNNKFVTACIEKAKQESGEIRLKKLLINLNSRTQEKFK